jgi:hypothetical protein
MRTPTRPVPLRCADRQGTGPANDTPTAALGRRLGLGTHTMRAYLDANGGSPDGVDQQRRSAAVVTAMLDRRLATHALPARCVIAARPPWVKRDRPRCFIAG